MKFPDNSIDLLFQFLYHDLMKIKKLIIIVLSVLMLQSVFAQNPPNTALTVQNELVRIEGGTFMMGSPENEPGRNLTDEGPQHRVTVSSFYISKYTVTQAEYQAVMGQNPSQAGRGPAFPVDSVAWIDAVNYCNRLSASHGLNPAYTINGNNVTWNRQANGYRLLTEAEWEYACRAGTTTPFNSGTTMDNAGWYFANTYFSTSGGSITRSTFPVGQKQPNAWGIYDMHGNVLEWCWDWFDLYPSSGEPRVDPTGPATGWRRAYRGGAWDFRENLCRSAYRFGGDPIYMRMHWIGFRVGRNDH